LNKYINIIITILGAILLTVGVLFYMNIIKIPETTKNTFQFQTLAGKTFNIHTDNKKIHIEGMENKVVFLKVFGWNCNFCKKEIPELIKLKKSLPESFDVIAIEAQKHTTKESKEFIKKFGINYHIVEGEKQKDFYNYLQKQYGWTGVIPLTIILSKDGEVLAFERGSKSYSLSELFQASVVKR